MESNNFNETDLSLLIHFGDDSTEFSNGTTQLLICEGEIYYGQFVLLGYNGAELTDQQKNVSNNRKHFSKMFFKRRLEPNGIKKGSIVKLTGNSSAVTSKAKSLRDSNMHTVSFGYGKNGTYIVEYLLDPTKDMFQIGRSSEEQIDFTIVDTWLAAGSQNVQGVQPSPNNNHSKGRLSSHRDNTEHSNIEQKPISSTISRYACRILAERDKPHRVQIFAAGFDSSKNIFLGEKATKWQKKNGEFDGLTTNGVLILHPNWCGTEQNDDTSEMYIWREVSVDGDIYTLRTARSSTHRGALVLGETNELQDGTLIDLCGATLLWRSAEGLKQSPSKTDLEQRLDELNAGKPQCPVNLNTLVIPRKRHNNKNNSSSKQPYVYFRCGHVQGKHNWGVQKTGNSITFRCPICLVDSERVAQLTMGMETAFHLDSSLLEYSFNPCGHMASKRTVCYWSRITMPHGTNSFHPVCPFCTSLLVVEKPFVRLIFQDHCYEN
jgi:pellino protein